MKSSKVLSFVGLLVGALCLTASHSAEAVPAADGTPILEDSKSTKAGSTDTPALEYASSGAQDFVGNSMVKDNTKASFHLRGGSNSVYATSDEALKEQMTEQEFWEMIEDKSEQGIKELIKKFYGEEMEKVFGRKPAKKIMGGMAGMIVAHITAPISAWNGDGAGAIDDVVGPIGAMAGGIIGGPVGAVVGAAISIIPSFVVNYFDTTQVQFYVSFVNVSPYHIRFSSFQTDYQKYWSVMLGWVPDEFDGSPVPNSDHKALYTYNGLKGYIIPKPVTFRGKDDFIQVAYTVPMAIHSKWAQNSFQLEALDNNGSVVKTYDVAYKYPGSYPFESHYIGIWENASWPRTDRDNYAPMDEMGHQGSEGKSGRPNTGTSGKSKAYWESWTYAQFELH